MQEQSATLMLANVNEQEEWARMMMQMMLVYVILIYNNEVLFIFVGETDINNKSVVM